MLSCYSMSLERGRLTLTEKEKDMTFEEEVSSETEEIEKDETTELKEKIDQLEDEREANAKYRSQDLAKAILPALDNLERALQTEVEDEAGKNLKQGVQMVLESFKAGLESVGVEEIEAEGQIFDPNFHEAYAQVPAEEGQESGVVAQVFEKGYKLHDRVLRAAKVTVTE